MDQQNPTTRPLKWSAMLLGFRAGTWWSIENLNCEGLLPCLDVHISPHSNFRTAKSVGLLALYQVRGLQLSDATPWWRLSVRFISVVNGNTFSLSGTRQFLEDNYIELVDIVRRSIDGADEGWFKDLRAGAGIYRSIPDQVATDDHCKMGPEARRLFAFVEEASLCI